MTITVQTQRGTVDEANSYASVEEMRAYHEARGVSLSAHTDEALAQALVRATDFMDSRYAFIGDPLKALQGTACPRYLDSNSGASYPKDLNTLEPTYLLTTAQWRAIVKACVQLAYRAATKTGGLMPDPSFDKTGQQVKSTTTKAGPVEKSIEYAEGSGQADASVPSYPAVDLLLRNVGLLRSKAGGSISRG